MVNAARILIEAARDAVEDISQPYDGYDADLVTTFTSVLQILREEPGDRAQRREIEALLSRFAAQVNTRVEES